MIRMRRGLDVRWWTAGGGWRQCGEEVLMLFTMFPCVYTPVSDFRAGERAAGQEGYLM